MLTRPKTKNALKPRALKAGDRVGLVCPAGRPANPAVVTRASKLLEEMGFKPQLGKHVLSTHGFMAGKDADRLADLKAFFEDDSIAGIFCITGGFGSLHLLSGLDFQAIAARPKLLAGCDDMTILLNAIWAHTGVVGLHAPNLEDVRSRRSFDRLKAAVMGSGTPAPLLALENGADPVESAADFYCAVEGSAEGRLCGGNLTAFASLLGTPFMPDLRGAILFLEDLGEQNGILDRWFTSLYLSGDLQYASAVALGSFEKCAPGDSANMLSVMDTFGDRLQYLGKTSCFGLPFGQKADTCPVPVGINARLDAGQGRLEFLENAFS